MNEIKINLSDEDMEALKNLLKNSNFYANNLSLSYSDVVTGLLRFYEKAELANYHEEYKNDIQIYIANLAISNK